MQLPDTCQCTYTPQPFASCRSTRLLLVAAAPPQRPSLLRRSLPSVLLPTRPNKPQCQVVGRLAAGDSQPKTQYALAARPREECFTRAARAVRAISRSSPTIPEAMVYLDVSIRPLGGLGPRPRRVGGQDLAAVNAPVYSIHAFPSRGLLDHIPSLTTNRMLSAIQPQKTVR